MRAQMSFNLYQGMGRAAAGNRVRFGKIGTYLGRLVGAVRFRNRGERVLEGCRLTKDPISISSSKLIAVIDDDEDVGSALVSLLESMSLGSVLFSAADAFLASSVHDQVDLVISDVQMPGTSGLELARILQQRGTPIILITAFPSPEVQRQAQEAGVKSFLRKPFNPTTLIEILNDLMD